MNRTERARKKMYREMENKARQNRNYYVRSLKEIPENFDYEGDPSFMREIFRGSLQEEYSKGKKHIKKVLKEEKIAVINSHKEKARA